MSEVNSSTNAQTRYWLPLMALLALPSLLAAIEISVWDSIDFGTRFRLWENPWQYLPYLFLIIMGAVWYNTRQPLPHIGRINLGIVASLLVLNTVLTSTVSPVPAIALQKQNLILGAALAGWASVYLARGIGARYVHGVNLALFAGILLHVPLVFVMIYLHKDDAGLAWLYRIPGFGGVRLYNYALEAGIAVGIGIFVTSTSGGYLRKITVLSGLAILWMMLFWSGGRGAVIALVGALILTSFILPKCAKMMWIAAVLSCMVGGAASVMIWTPEGGSFGLLEIAQRTATIEVNSLSSGRMDLWRGTLDFISQKPVFGHGLMQITALWTDAQEATNSQMTRHMHAHNIVLDIFLAFGVVGGVFLLFLLAKIWLVSVLRVRKSANPAFLGALLAVNSLLSHSLISGTYYHAHSIVYIALLLGICLSVKARPAQQ